MKTDDFIRLNKLHDKGKWTHEELAELESLYRKFFVGIIKSEFPNVAMGKLIKFIPVKQK